MPTLMTVSGLELPLEINRSYILGRGLDCDIVVADVVSSRIHARLTIGEVVEEVYIEDLGSRNGTWVNEIRITKKTRVRDGASVRIGATVYLLNILDSGAANMRPLLETSTETIDAISLGSSVGKEIAKVVKRQGTAPTDFAGQLGAFSLIEILQLLTQTRRSGTLHLALTEGHARVDIRLGEVIASEYGRLSGFDALLALANEPQGLFWMVDSQAPCDQTIDKPASRLLLELCSALDEQAH